MPPSAPLLATPDEVTPDWLTAALVASGRVPASARVSAITSTSSIGNGKVGQNIRFALEWEGDGAEAAPASIVGKFASDDPTSRQAGLMTGTYLREAAFYQELAERAGPAVPRCHVAELDPAAGVFVLLFDDITPAETGDQITGCTVDEAALAVEEAARLHARFWADPVLAGRDWLVRRNHDEGAGLAMLYEALAAMFLDRYRERLSANAIDVVERFTPLVRSWVMTDGDPVTLIHGDYRLENLLFGRGPDVAPLTIVDWQTPSIGPGPSDVAYFLGGGLPVEDRRAHERDLVETYRNVLAVEGDIQVDPDTLWQSYRANAFTGVHMTTVASVLVGQDDRADLMFLAMIERHTAHVTDLDAFAAIS